MEKISEHAKQKYITRIKGLKLDSKEVSRYLVENKNQIESELLKLFEFSELFYEGLIGKGTQKASKFYINGEIILVVSRNGLDLVTLYKVNFNYGSDEDGSIDKMVAKRLLNQIKKIREQKDELKITNNDKIKEITYSMDAIKEQIKIHETLVAGLKTQLKSKESELATINTNIAILDTEINTKCTQLINYVEYQKSLDLK